MNREAIAEQLEAQRQRLWHGQGVCVLAARTAEDLHEEAHTAITSHLWTALKGLEEVLEQVTGALEPDVILGRDADSREAKP